MKKIFLFAIINLVFFCPVFAQFTTVTYDTDRKWFNEGQALPAEKSMLFKGVISEQIERVEIQILSSKNNLLYTCNGKRQSNNEFVIPVNYKLRSSDKYDFQIAFFQNLSEKGKISLTEKIQETLDTYIDVNLSGSKSIKLLKKPSKTVREMNEIVADILNRYRSEVSNLKPEFSEVIRLKLEQLDKADLSVNYSKGDTSTTVQEVRKSTRVQLINELRNQIKNEVNQLLEGEMLVLSSTQNIDDYPTESIENGLSLNIGYGGVYLSGDLNDFTYGSSPYVGLAFPLGNSVLGSKILSNSSVTIGFFLENFENEDGEEVTGFLVDRPIYLGLDHRLFKFLRINAGATFLEDTNTSGTTAGRNVMVRPYVGLSARIDLSIGLGK